VLDRHRFAHLFLAASEAPVLEALRPYQNEDGGFGNALEPDLRAPVSQPLPVWTALTVLDESDGFDDPMGLEKTSPYEVMMVLQFLENVDDRVRAEEPCRVFLARFTWSCRRLIRLPRM